MSEENENRRKVQYVYLGCLTPVLQNKFLGYFQEAEKHGVTTEQFVRAWNSYAMSIEEHVFITETPGKVQVPLEGAQ
jgi:hypothetical protein